MFRRSSRLLEPRLREARVLNRCAALGRAREKTRRVACMGNIRQFLVGVQVYAGDYRECLPVGLSDARDPDITRAHPTWRRILEQSDDEVVVTRLRLSINRGRHPVETNE